jgi:hypothetical protein
MDSRGDCRWCPPRMLGSRPTYYPRQAWARDRRRIIYRAESCAPSSWLLRAYSSSCCGRAAVMLCTATKLKRASGEWSSHGSIGAVERYLPVLARASSIEHTTNGVSPLLPPRVESNGAKRFAPDRGARRCVISPAAAVTERCALRSPLVSRFAPGLPLPLHPSKLAARPRALGGGEGGGAQLGRAYPYSTTIRRRCFS